MKLPEKTLKDKILNPSYPMMGALVLLVCCIVMNLNNYVVPSALLLGSLLLGVLGLTLFTIQKSLFMYAGKRVFEAFFVIVLIATLTFLLLRMLPGGPFDSDKALTPEVQANIEKKYNLDKPLISQYLMYMKDVARGDLGLSYKYLSRSVTDIIKDTVPASFLLGFYALLIAFLIGIPLGVLAASKHNTIWDSTAMFFAISGVALPSFLVAAVFVLLFSLGGPKLPSALWESSLHYILPVVTLGIRPMASIARLVRSSVLEVISADYIRTAKAKGLSQFTILYKHVLKNSLIPVLTFSGPLIAGILTGSFIIEQVFEIPGMGRHLVSSVNNRDYPLILGLTLLYSILLVISNLIVDLLYAYFDPRIQLS